MAEQSVADLIEETREKAARGFITGDNKLLALRLADALEEATKERNEARQIASQYRDRVGRWAPRIPLPWEVKTQ